MASSYGPMTVGVWSASRWWLAKSPSKFCLWKCFLWALYKMDKRVNQARRGRSIWPSKVTCLNNFYKIWHQLSINAVRYLSNILNKGALFARMAVIHDMAFFFSNFFFFISVYLGSKGLYINVWRANLNTAHPSLVPQDFNIHFKHYA